MGTEQHIDQARPPDRAAGLGTLSNRRLTVPADAWLFHVL
jgi:hypothetical protein